jgi:putative holliday junction resolvase
MSVIGLEELGSVLQPGHRLLGLDLGEKTIGLALSDRSLTVATPLKTLKRGKFKTDAAEILSLIAEHDISAIIVGWPLNMDGSEGPAAQSARAFARNFAGAGGCPVVLVDERLSTAAVTRTLLHADTSRARRRKVVDKMAAAYILQGALDRLRILLGARK